MAETRPAVPKPLVKLGGIPLIEIVVRQLVWFGFEEIHIALRHKAEMVIDHLTSCGDLDSEQLHFIVEEEPLGTIGALAHLKDAGKTIVTTNGDLLSGIDLGRMFDFHRRYNADMTIATHSEYHRLKLGEVESREDLLITDYHEKPVKEYHICSGTSLIEVTVLDMCKQGQPVQFPDLVKNGLARALRILNYYHREPWIDINDEKDLSCAEEILSGNPQAFFLPPGLFDLRQSELPKGT